ncbi:MAG TPA: SDR family oxidoreductase [Gemmataceae bacterium]|nr:SDR family oxidoreductase [Gemmataceae bacterium]
MAKTSKTLLCLAAGSAALWYLTRQVRGALISFAHKNVFITGGSRGLGLVLARRFSTEGARVAICARDADEHERAARDSAWQGERPLTVVADVTDPVQVRQAVSRIEGDLGPIDVLVNNASIISVGPVSTMTREDFEEAMRITFWGAFNAIQAVVPGMRERGDGRIVNISSIGGKIGVPHLAPYCASKFALSGYSQALRAELADDGITVTTIYPGLMRTGSPRNAVFKARQEAEYGWFKVSASLPLLTVSAEHAARCIMNATRRGDAELVISLPAKAGIVMHALFPEMTSTLISLANRLLPSAGGAGRAAKPGKDIELPAALAPVTALMARAAESNNEINPVE